MQPDRVIGHYDIGSLGGRKSVIELQVVHAGPRSRAIIDFELDDIVIDHFAEWRLGTCPRPLCTAALYSAAVSAPRRR